MALHLTLVFLLGCAGGAVPDVLRLIAVRHQGAPAYLQTWFFWISLVLLMMIGGATALLVRADTILEALATGFSGPEILSRLLATPSPADRGPEREGALRRWWAN